MKIKSILVFVFLIYSSNAAISQVQGPFYEVNARGLDMYCTSYYGEPVPIYFNYQLNNVGIATRSNAGTPYIVLNPNVLAQFSDTVAQWWFAHECAHHALPPQYNSESNADCYAIRQLVNYGVIYDYQQLEAFAHDLWALAGSPSGHLPGPLRAQNIANCALN